MRTCPGGLSEPTPGDLRCSRGEFGCLVDDARRAAASGDARAAEAFRSAHERRLRTS